jgi:hypothetical protein
MRNFCVLLVTLLATAHGQTATTQKSQPAKTVGHAQWIAALEANFGISQQDFRDMGLSALTPEQEFSVLIWASGREQKAKESVVVPSFDCGRPGQKFEDAKPDEYDKVHVNVNATGTADEIISNVRERFRTMNGVEVVYTSDEADLTVNLVGVNMQTKGGYASGVAISVIVTQPCTYKAGTYAHEHASLLDHFVQVGSDAPTVVNSIVATIDTDAFENQRKTNAQYKKYLQDQKKK